MQTPSPTRGLSRRARLALLGALALVLSLAAPSFAQSSDELAPGEISMSSNVSLLTNIPRQGVNDGQFHSDIAFFGDLAIQGTYGGLNFYDISRPRKTELVSQVACEGGQGDPSVSEDGSLVFMSVDSARSDSTCESDPSSPAVESAWEGIRIFDITDVEEPEYVAAVQTDCGSHTHTLVPDDEGEVVYLYISSYGPSTRFPNCQPPHDSISIVEVPLDDPAAAEVVAKVNLFPDGGQSRTAGCHDITVYPELDLAGGACMGEGVLMDISDPVAPYVIDTAVDTNFAFWHSATFNDDASKVVFTDELGGGGAPTCNEAIGPQRGANAIFDITGEGDDRELEFQSYFKIPRNQTPTENCVAHNGSIIPIPGRDIMVQSWYQGGVSVFEFTDSQDPVEIAYFERGPLTGGIGGSWSAYWYNGFIYSSDITEGLDVLRVTALRGPPSTRQATLPFLNAQTQYEMLD